jgi:ribose transport system substrate-binding protein
MKRYSILICLIGILIVVFAGNGIAEEKKPYCFESGFKAYVKVDKETIWRPDDERVVKPVNFVASKPIKIAFVGGATNPFFDAVKSGVDAATAELAPHNVKVEWIVPGIGFASADYAEAIDNIITRGYNGIVTMVFNEGLINAVGSAVDSGVSVISTIVNSEDPNKALTFIGQDLYQGGVTAAHALAKELGGKGKVGVITGFYSLQGHENRRMGFTDTIEKEYPGIEIVGHAENLDQADKAFEITNTFLVGNPDLAAVYNTAGGPTGAIEALIQAGKIDTVKVACFYVPELADYVRKGQCSIAIAQDAYAEGRDTCVRLFNYLMTGETPPARNLYTEAFVVTPETLDEFIASGQGA